MKVAVVGCGHMAHIHIRYILRAQGVRLLAVCDQNEIRAQEVAQRYSLPYYTNLAQMLKETQPDAVHILTPPQTHTALTIQALGAGCHVLVEKPMCLTLEEADRVIDSIRTSGKKLCVDHTHLFTPLFRKAKDALDSGRLGDIIYVEGLISDDYIDRLNKGSAGQWAQQLRGGKMADLIPHPLYTFLGLVPNLRVESAFGHGVDLYSLERLTVQFTSPTADATLTMLLRQRPLQHRYRIYCTKGILEIAWHHFSMIENRQSNLPNSIARVTYNIVAGTQIVTNTISNVVGFLLGRFDPNAGIRNLIEVFYQSIRDNQPSPVPAEAGRKVVELSASIWDYLERKRCLYPPAGFEGKRRRHARDEQAFANRIQQPAKVLVTGGTGFIGSRLIQRLVENGEQVRVLCRKFSNFSKLPDEVEIAFGDMRNKASLRRAVEDIETIYHLAVTTGGEWGNYVRGTIEGTHNLLTAASAAGVRKFIYLSSLGVLHLAALREGTIVDETMPLENRPEARGAYSRAKIETEKVVRNFASQNKPSIVIIRPGVVCNPGKDTKFLSDAGITLGNKLILAFSSGNRVLRLTHIENLIDGLLLAVKRNSLFIEIYHLVDEDLPSLREYVNTYCRMRGWKIPVFYIPVPILLTGFGLLEVLLGAVRDGPRPALRYRVRTITRNLCYDTSRARQALGWRPKGRFLMVRPKPETAIR